MAADSHDGRVDGLPGDVVEDILASERRRAMLSCLADSEGPVAVDDVVAAVCASEQGPDRGRVREEIYERHLPKLTATGVVEYHSMREAVELVDEDLARQL